MNEINATKFKEQCLSLLKHINPEGMIITRHGRPVAKLLPLHGKSGSLIGRLNHKIHIKGNIYSTGLKWNDQP